MKHIQNPAIWIAIGTVITLIGALWSSQNQASFEKKLSSKSEEISQNQSRFEKELSLKNEEIIQLNNKLMGLVTGGNSFCRFSVMNLPNDNLIHIALMHEGKYPLYDMKVRVVDLDDFEKQINTNTGHLIEIGNLIPMSTFPDMFKIPINQRKNIRFNFFFSGRNGYFTQELRLILVGDDWKIASRVADNITKPGEYKLLFEEIDPELKKNGKFKF